MESADAALDAVTVHRTWSPYTIDAHYLRGLMLVDWFERACDGGHRCSSSGRDPRTRPLLLCTICGVSTPQMVRERVWHIQGDPPPP